MKSAGKQTKKHNKIMNLLKFKKALSLWDNILTIVSLVGLLLLVYSYMAQKNLFILMFGQITAIVSTGSVFFFSYMLVLKNVRRNLSTILILLGSLGSTFGEISQITSGDIYNTEPILHIATLFLSTGILLHLNQIFKNQNKYGKNI